MWGAGMMGQVWPRLRPRLLGALLATAVLGCGHAALGSVLGSVLGTVVSWAQGTCVVCVLGTVVCWAQGPRVARPRSARGVLVVRLLWRGRCLMVAGTLPDEDQCRWLEQEA